MKTELFIAGDSHAGVIARVVRDKGIPFQGGPIAGGAALHKMFFRVEDGDFVLTGNKHGNRARLFMGLLRHEGPVLSTIGFDSHMFAIAFGRYLANHHLQLGHISDGVLTQCILDSRKGVLAFYQTLRDHGREVYFTCSPQRVDPALYGILTRYEATLIDLIKATGATFIDVRPDIMDGTTIRPQYAADDIVHGSDAWGELVLEKLEAARLQTAG